MYLFVHCSIMYNSQDMETTQVFPDGIKCGTLHNGNHSVIKKMQYCHVQQHERILKVLHYMKLVKWKGTRTTGLHSYVGYETGTSEPTNRLTGAHNRRVVARGAGVGRG